MESNYKLFSLTNSIQRISDILNEQDNSYIDATPIPSRDKLTFTNGFYVQCVAIFIDIRDSSKLTSSHKRPTLAKLYRAFISEMVATMNSTTYCRETNIVGDCVSGIFDGQYVHQIQEAYRIAFTLASIVDVLNWQLTKRNISEIRVGIGIDYGNALMIKAGYKGSTINDVVWMGNVVNHAAKLANRASKGGNYRIMVSSDVYINLAVEEQNLLSQNYAENCYHGNVGSSQIIDFLQSQR